MKIHCACGHEYETRELPIYDKDPDVTSIIIGTDEHEGGGA